MRGSEDQQLKGSNDCGCCSGISVQTPVKASNRPGLNDVAYRVGDHWRFYQTMLSRLQSRPELGDLSTREESDFSIALLDAWAVIADILTFYQERIANESYLRTARERRSVLELARTLGYELSPGVAASVYLAFNLEDAPGSPGEAVVEVGTKVQSTPGQNEKPQIFETVERLEARAEWNAIRPKLTERRLPQKGDGYLYLKGISTNFKKGDGLLIVGKEWQLDRTSDRWDFRKISSVVTEPSADRTLVILDKPLGSESSDPSKDDPRVYALRLRAAIFGHNAIKLDVNSNSPSSNSTKKSLSSDSTSKLDGTIIYLDSVYSQVIRDSWVILTRSGGCEGSSADPQTELYQVMDVGEETKVEVESGIAAKTTRLEISGENINYFSPCSTTVYAQSEELELAETPLTDPIYGNQIEVDMLAKLPIRGQKLAIRGKRARIRIGEKPLTFISTKDPTIKQEFQPGDELILVEAPVSTYEHPSIQEYLASPIVTWHVMDDKGFEGKASGTGEVVRYAPAAEGDEVVSELVDLKDDPIINDDGLGGLNPVGNLKNIYDRATVTISANVTRATHGESTTEVLGSGNASIRYQRFSLKQLPLTYISQPTSTGVESTLKVRVNDILWHEVPNLSGHGQNERVYAIKNGDDGMTIVQFGSRLPTGQENVRATYRRGLGEAGLVKANQLNILMTRPAGVKGASNPLPAEGGQDPQALEDARRGAPLTVLTLDRIVSLQDYEDFARNYGGIAKAMATWTWNGVRRGVLVTVAGPGGAEVNPGNPVHDNLLISMRRYGDPRVPLTLKSGLMTTFKLKAWIRADPDILVDKVKSGVEEALRRHFSFDARDFGQPVTLGEVMSVIQKAPGVMAANVEALYRSDAMEEDLKPILAARTPLAGSDDASAAEILILAPSPVDLVVMP